MIAAFFDMDHTLLRCNTGSKWIGFLRRRREISFPHLLRAMGWVAQYKLSILDMESVTARVTAEMMGDSEQEMIDKCRIFAESEVLREIAPKAREAVARHRDQGHLLAILTSSTPYVTRILADHLGIQHLICTQLEVAEGKFVGRHVRPTCYGQGKVHWAESFASEHQIDLDRSYFYTDSFTDLPMLERVGERRVINPDVRLRRHATQVGWSVEIW